MLPITKLALSQLLPVRISPAPTRFIGAALLLTCCALPGIARADQTLLNLDSTNSNIKWKVQPKDMVNGDDKALAANDFDATRWVSASVPGTIFGSYVDAGLEKDPNFGDNIYKVDKTKYERDFWYRTEFQVPASAGPKVWLNFEGVNRKGDIYFNGTNLGHLDGFMQRGHYDITSLIRKGQKNVLAVLIQCPKEPIPNIDMPTYMSSASWDWMPRVPGLLAGVTDDVSLSTSGAVTLSDPWVRSDLPIVDKAEVSLNVEVNNLATTAANGTLTGVIQPGNIRISQPVMLEAGQTKTVGFDKNQFKQLVINNPKLWWPNGYGDPNLYHCDLKFEIGGKISDVKTISFGIKKYSYDTNGDVLHLHINGKPLFLKGGNWGMSEYMLRCRGSEYDLKVKLHKEMNFNVIRNWIGSTTDEEFYEACDKYGIMVWDDFWLNSHPNLPADIKNFNGNAIEKIKRFRNHPSIALWCGDNEGTPLPPLNDWLRADVQTYDGGDRWYQPCSNTGALSGSGPWTNMDPAWYFTKYPRNFSNRPSFGLRSEMGTAVFTNFESFKKFMPRDSWWPRNEMWNKHFFGPSAGNAGPDRYVEAITRSYGAPTGLEDFCRKAQLLNIEINKAMFEGWQHNMWDDASGVMTWMSQSAYPSFVWQTYDYYYDLNGAYWGAKVGCEPLHIQWNSGDNSIKIINTTGTDQKNLRAQFTVYNIDGKPAPRMQGTKTIANVPSNSAAPAFDLKFNTENLAYKTTATASSTEDEDKVASMAVDGGAGSRWSSKYEDNQWITVDLGAPKPIAQIRLVWEAAYGKAYKLQLSNDNSSWQDVYSTEDSDGGSDVIDITPTTARYVHMLGLKRATMYGFSLYEFEVYSNTKRSSAVSNVHFIELKLTDSAGKLVSQNFYWRSLNSGEYTDFNTLPKANLQVKTTTSLRNGKYHVQTTITNPTTSPVALAIRVTPVKADTGEQILPVIMNDNYFSLMKGQSRVVEMDFDQAAAGKSKVAVKVEPYNNR